MAAQAQRLDRLVTSRSPTRLQGLRVEGAAVGGLRLQVPFGVGDPELDAGGDEAWRDEATRRQIAFQNLVVGLLDAEDMFNSVIASSRISAMDRIRYLAAERCYKDERE